MSNVANPFNTNELVMLRMLLEELSEHQSNTGCNDLIIPASTQLVAFANEFNRREDVYGLEIDGDSITGVDLDVTAYFMNRIDELLNTADSYTLE